MDIAATKILSDLKAKKIAPVYVLQGEETYYIDVISDYMEQHLLSDSEKSFNQFVLYGREAPVGVILSQARRFPMMAERQVIIVKEAQDIPDLFKEIGSKLFIDYLTRPVPSTVLVLCHKNKSIDKRRELGKKVEQLTVSATFKKPFDNQSIEFIGTYLRGKGVEIQDVAIQVLHQFIGNDLQRLANEMDKVLISLGHEKTITVETLMPRVGMNREYNVFELQKAVVNKDALLAARIVNYFASNTKKNPAIPTVALLYYFFSKLLLAASLSGNENIASALKISPYASKDYSSALLQYSLAKIIDNVSLLREADLKLKGVNSGADDQGQILKELVFRLMM